MEGGAPVSEWTVERRNKLSESLKRSWVLRKKSARKIATKLALREFAETQLLAFDRLPQCQRVRQFMVIVNTIMKNERTP